MTEQNPDGSRRYRQSKIFFPQTIKSKSYFVIKQDKTTLFRLIQFITGHAFMRRHNYLMQGNGDEPQPPCRLCLQGTPPPPILRRHFSHENDDLWKRYPAPQHRGLRVEVEWRAAQDLYSAPSRISSLFMNADEDETHDNAPPSPRSCQRGRRSHPLQ